MFFRISVMAPQTRPETELANRKLLSVTTASASAGTTEYQTLSPPRSAFLRQGDMAERLASVAPDSNGSGRLCTGLDLEQIPVNFTHSQRA